MSLGKVEDALFLKVCELLNELEAINKANSIIPKKKLHLRAISRWFDHFSGGDVYLGFRMVAPEIDLHRCYYLKEKKLAGLLAEILGVSDTSRGKMLVNWRVDSRLGKSQADLSAVLYDIVRGAEHVSTSRITIKDVNILLDEVVSCKRISGGFTQFDAIKGTPVLTKLYQDMTAIEIKWLTRIILKDLQLKIEPRVFFDAFHGWMWKIYSHKNDLKLACETVLEMIKRGYTSATKLGDEEFRSVFNEFFRSVLGTNIAIMACGRAQGLQHVVERLKGHQCFVEQKFDGERLQAHLCKSWPERIKIFSKSGRDSTRDRYRCHEQLLEALKFNDPVCNIETCIVEGELVVYNEKSGKIENFGTVQDLQAWKSTYNGDIVGGGRHYFVILFDLLHLNGQDLTSKPLHFRRALLETLVKVRPNHVELSKLETVDFSTSEGLEKLNSIYSEAMRQRQEGLIIKKKNSPYLPGNRTEWLKLKKDYIEGFGDTAEFAVIGLAYGKAGKGLLSTFLVGVLTNKEELLEDDKVEPKFLLLFTVSQGLTEDELSLFNERAKSSGLFPLASDKTEISYKYEFAKGFQHDIDYLIKTPILVELLGSGFVKERGQPHFVLRFPRILKVYFDRSIQDSVSFQELQAMAENSFTAGHECERGEGSKMLLEHANEQMMTGNRAPSFKRPDRLILDEKMAGESPSKMVKKMRLESPIEIVQRKYFFHVPVDHPRRGEITASLYVLNLETLYHLEAVAACDNRKCVVVDCDEKILQTLRDYGLGDKDVFAVAAEHIDASLGEDKIKLQR